MKAAGNRGKGRPKGSRNKLTHDAKEALEAVFVKRGGIRAFKAWSDANPDGFYAIWAKLLPKSIEAKLTGPGIIEVRFVHEALHRTAG